MIIKDISPFVSSPPCLPIRRSDFCCFPPQILRSICFYCIILYKKMIDSCTIRKWEIVVPSHKSYWQLYFQNKGICMQRVIIALLYPILWDSKTLPHIKKWNPSIPSFSRMCRICGWSGEHFRKNLILFSSFWRKIKEKYK